MARPFADRHLGPAPSDAAVMLELLGHTDIEGLIATALPAGIASEQLPSLPPAVSEAAVLAELRELADRNQLVRPPHRHGLFARFNAQRAAAQRA